MPTARSILCCATSNAPPASLTTIRLRCGASVWRGYSPIPTRQNELITLLGPALGLVDIAPADAAPAGSKAETLALLQDLLLAPAADQPLCILVEDAQWIDPTTQELLSLLIDRLGDRRVLLLITHRPEFIPPWGTRAHLTQLAMNRLSARACAGLIGDLARGKALPEEVLRQIIAKADGVPLFVEELTKAVLESGLLREDTDAWRLDGPLPPLAIPSSLHDSFMARLDRMAPVKEVAQVGAAIGREFSSRLLAPVLDMNEAALGAALTQLVDAGLLVSRGGDIYAFKHALTRDAAYASLLSSRRQICHQRIATALEEFDDGFVRATEPELLAYHYQEAGDFSAALAHWIAAGDIAEQRGANAEAIAHYRSAKALTENADLSAADRARAAEVLLKLGNAQWQTAGYQAEEVMQSYRAGARRRVGIGPAGRGCGGRHSHGHVPLRQLPQSRSPGTRQQHLAGRPGPLAPGNAGAPLGDGGFGALPYRQLRAVAGLLGEGDRAG